MSELMMAPCPKLQEPGSYDLSGLAQSIIEISGNYYECSAKHQALSDAVRENQK